MFFEDRRLSPVSAKGSKLLLKRVTVTPSADRVHLYAMSLSPEPGDVAAEESSSSSATGDNARGSVCGGWVSLTGDGNPFDINLGLARCRYSVADYAGTVHGDAVVVVPAEFRFASQMIAHAVLPADGRCGGLVEIAVHRPSVRCAKPYRFAYVGGRLCDVMAISGAFAFVHGDDGLCDCDDAAAAADDDLATEPFSSAEPRLSAAFGIGAFVSSVMDRRSSAQRCPVCAIPSNHRLVLTHLTENIDRLSVVDANFHRLHKKYKYPPPQSSITRYDLISVVRDGAV